MSDTPRKVLLVEDETLVAMMVENLLEDLGYEALADMPARLEDAVSAAEAAAFDVALLDLSLAGVRTYAVADILKARGKPFAFLTGYRAEDLEPAYREVPILAKPFRRGDLEAVLDRLTNHHSA